MENEFTRIQKLRRTLTLESPSALRQALEELSHCPNCSVHVGVAHMDDCSIARCMATGLQRLQCLEDHPCGSDRWSGLYPGTVDAIEKDLWACFEPGVGWVPGSPDDDRAMPDLNALLARCLWNPRTQQWQEP